MKHLNVNIELGGVRTPVGRLLCDESGNASFIYEEAYLHRQDASAISLSLPLQREGFSPNQTKNFFDGLLPEGFTRKSVARWMQLDEKDYLSLLYGLGRECLGAIQISDGSEWEEASYEKLSLEQVKHLANEGTVKSSELVARSHLSLTGASGKVGLYYDSDQNEWYLPHGNAPSTHIVKQSHVRLDGIVTNEQLCLLTAAAMGITVPDSFIINTGTAQEWEVLFATRRYDRAITADSRYIDGKICPWRLHQEDFAQALGIPSSDKYEKQPGGYLRRMFELLRNYSADPIADQITLWKIVIFDFLIGNTDNHIKNLSLLYGKDLKTLRLAPAYDLVSTTTYEASTRDMAFYIGGQHEIDQISADTFRRAAAEIGLGEKMAMKYFEEMGNSFETALAESARRLTDMGFQKASAIRERILQTGGIHTL